MYLSVNTVSSEKSEKKNGVSDENEAKIEGRWDITFVEKPKYQYNTYFSPITKPHLMVMKNKHPEAWLSLMGMILEVHEETQSAIDVLKQELARNKEVIA